MNGIRKTYLYVYGSQRILDIRRVYQSAGLKRLIISLVDMAIYSMCQPRNVLYCKVFLWKYYVHGLGSQKMPDDNLHTLGNLHNQAN